MMHIMRYMSYYSMMSRSQFLSLHRTLCIFVSFFLWLHASPLNFAESHPYRIIVSKPLDRYIINSTFTGLQNTFTLQNAGDPVYVFLEPRYEKELVAVNLFEDTNLNAISSKKPILMLSSETKNISVEIAALQMFPEDRDYLIDVEIRIEPIYKPQSDEPSVYLVPQIHKFVVLSHTKEDFLNVDPKIALFQNTGGPFAISTQNQSIVAIVQNRGNHLMAIEGNVAIEGPNGYSQNLVIQPAYVFGQRQINLTTLKNDSTNVITLPKNTLKTGRYQATINLFVGDRVEQLYAQTTFWIVSPLFIGVLMLICFGMIGGVLFTAFSRR